MRVAADVWPVEDRLVWRPLLSPIGGFVALFFMDIVLKGIISFIFFIGRTYTVSFPCGKCFQRRALCVSSLLL